MVKIAEMRESRGTAFVPRSQRFVPMKVELARTRPASAAHAFERSGPRIVGFVTNQFLPEAGQPDDGGMMPGTGPKWWWMVRRGWLRGLVERSGRGAIRRAADNPDLRSGRRARRRDATGQASRQPRSRACRAFSNLARLHRAAAVERARAMRRAVEAARAGRPAHVSPGQRFAGGAGRGAGGRCAGARRTRVGVRRSCAGAGRRNDQRRPAARPGGRARGRPSLARLRPACLARADARSWRAREIRNERPWEWYLDGRGSCRACGAGWSRASGQPKGCWPGYAACPRAPVSIALRTADWNCWTSFGRENSSIAVETPTRRSSSCASLVVITNGIPLSAGRDPQFLQPIPVFHKREAHVVDDRVRPGPLRERLDLLRVRGGGDGREPRTVQHALHEVRERGLRAERDHHVLTSRVGHGND